MLLLFVEYNEARGSDLLPLLKKKTRVSEKILLNGVETIVVIKFQF